jgi:hypothetical protein
MSLLLDVVLQDYWVSASLGRGPYCSDPTMWDELQGSTQISLPATKDPPQQRKKNSLCRYICERIRGYKSEHKKTFYSLIIHKALVFIFYYQFCYGCWS